ECDVDPRRHVDTRGGKADAMSTPKPADKTPETPERPPRRVRLPGFVGDKDIGLGDLVKRATASIGIGPCAGCERRAAALNRWMVFGRRR
ncbi:MAG: hypothetical protein ACREF9_09680, partial [Opitutaceae bacterium]